MPAGKCRICGCTEKHACIIEDLMGDRTACAWFNRSKTLCTNPKCLAADFRTKKGRGK